MAATGAMDVGRGARRFGLPNGMTIGEGWVNDPRQAYDFSKAGIVPQDTGELEGVHGEGVTGAVPGLSSGGAAMAGLRAAMGRGGAGGEDDPGASLMRRLTSSPATAAEHGLIDDPETVAARNAALQHQYGDIANPKTGVQSELEREDIQSRAGTAMSALKAQIAGPNEDALDLQSERAAQRLDLPWAAHNRYYANQDLLDKLRTQYLEPEQLKSETAGYTADAALAGHQATAGASESDAALKALSSLIENAVRSQGAGGTAIDDPTLKALMAQLLGRVGKIK